MDFRVKSTALPLTLDLETLYLSIDFRLRNTVPLWTSELKNTALLILLQGPMRGY
jgi:hypothetical protein